MLASTQFVNQLKLKQSECMIQLILRASICHKSELPPQKKAYRWPYEKRAYGCFNFFLDPFTKKKFNENSKIIQVEGNISSGKEEFSRQLADELGMHYMPPVNLEEYYYNRQGYDYRALNPLLPERLRLCDWEMFHDNPSRHSTIHMQHILFKLRLFQYVKAIQHLFNTGQGVVISRSVFGERVFVEAMHNMGWLPKGYLRGDGTRFYDYKVRYLYIRNLALAGLLKPHLTIYLDTPVETCMERVQNSSDPLIANSKAMVPEFLENIEKAYNDIVLPKQEMFSNLMRIEHPKSKTRDEILDIIDDIKDMDFEYECHDTRFEDWKGNDKGLWYFEQRRYYTTLKFMSIFEWLEQPWWDVAGLGDSITQVDLKLRQSLFEGHVGPFGVLYEYETNPKYHNPLKIFFNIKDYGERVRNCIYCDFV